MNEHLDLDALADVLAGDGDGAEHLAACEACRGRLAQLELAMPGVSASLAGLPQPSEPADLGERISRTLQPERLPASATVVPLAAGRPTRWLPVLAAVAAAAVVAVGAVVVVNQQDGGSNGDDGTAYALSSTGADYGRDGKALTAALPQLLEGGAPVADREVTTMMGSPEVAGPTPTVEPSKPTADTAAQGADPLDVLRTDEGLAACLVALTDPGDPAAGVPLALDYASFEGRPALVVVLPTPKGDKVDVFVVGAGCSQADAQLLFFTRLPKP